MDSPSALSVSQRPADSLINCDGPPSSPFVTEVDPQSRNPSGHWKPPIHVNMASDDMFTLPNIFETPPKPTATAPHMDYNDKENMPMAEDMQKLSATPPPQKSMTPEPRLLSTAKKAATFDASRRGSANSDLMPPPSARKVNTSSRKTPLKASQSAANTPRPTSRGSSNGRTPVATGMPQGRTPATAQRTPSAFKAGLASMQNEDTQNVDDTCFSAFSEVPEMTLFSKLAQSPTKRGDVMRTPGAMKEQTPATSRKRTPTSRSPSPTPRRQKSTQNQDGTTSFLIDFTQQFDSIKGGRPASPAKSSTESNLLQYINTQRSPNKAGRQSYSTPNKSNNILNLLDFELPPAPTPRSVPTITVRELESLKSSYLSQISSLKATLSGREAEVDSLKKAVGDAERRVGEAQEGLRDEKCRREHVEQEKAGWEKRGKEVESVLNSVKEEVMKSEVEREEMAKKLEQSETQIENAEERATKAEERFADALAARATADGGDANDMEEQVRRLVSAQIDSKIEAVSRELHSVYKEKHERKVATLKKSYEARGEKKCSELQTRLADLEKQNDELITAKDATFSGPVPDTAGDAELKAQIEEQKAAVARLENEIQTSQQQHEQLMHELQQERIEKGDLVAAVDEMLALQSEQKPTQGAMTAVEDFRKSISCRPSGLKTPSAGVGSGESMIGRGVPPPSLSRSTSGGKSRMLANIERMGRSGNGGPE